MFLCGNCKRNGAKSEIARKIAASKNKNNTVLEHCDFSVL
jgi:hypothetical protein